MELETALRAISAYAPCIRCNPRLGLFDEPTPPCASWHNVGSKGENNTRRGGVTREPCVFPAIFTGTLFPAKNLVECVDGATDRIAPCFLPVYVPVNPVVSSLVSRVASAGSCGCVMDTTKLRASFLTRGDVLVNKHEKDSFLFPLFP